MSNRGPVHALAYAAHELRGEIALQLALVEVALADPNADTARPAGDGRARRRRLPAAGTVARGAADARPQRARTSATGARRPRRDRRRGPASPRSSRAQEHDGARARPHHRRSASWSSASSRTWSRTPSVTTFRAAGSISGRTPPRDARSSRSRTPDPLIPSGELTRLFRPFQRLSAHSARSVDGVGLGLAIVQAIANAHDATVTARAQAGGGLGIDVAFPALD